MRSATRLILAYAAALVLSQNARAVLVTWDGGSIAPTNNWNDGGNWVGDVAPVGGDSLAFEGAVQTTNVNNFAAGTNFAGITIGATYGNSATLSGNSVNLSGDLAFNRTSSGSVTTLSTPFALQQNVAVDVPSGNATFNVNGAITGAFKVIKTGSGIVSLGSNANAFSNGLDVNAGTLRMGASGNSTGGLGAGTVTIANNAVLELRSTTSTTFNNALALGTGGGWIAIRSNHTFSPTSITGASTLTLAPTGADNLVFTSNDMKNWNGQINLNRNGRLNFGLRLGNSFVTNSLANTSIDLGDATFISRQNGTNNLGTNVVDIGALSSSVANSALGASAAGTGYFVYSIGGKNATTSFSGNIIDGSTKSALRKVGNADLTLAGSANTFSGPSSVDGGRLIVSGALTNVNLTLTVNTNGTLGGAGTIAGVVTVVDGSLAPGASAGTLAVGGLVLGSDAKLSFELNGANTTGGMNVNDMIADTGALTLDGTLNVAEIGAGSFLSATAGNSWRLINYTGALTDNGLALGTTPTLASGLFFTIDTSVANQINLLVNATAVPEASALLCVGVAVTLGAGRTILRRRANRAAV